MSCVVCPKCDERIEVFGPSQAVHTAMQLGVPLLGQLSLDPDLSRRADAGEIEEHPMDALVPIAGKIVERASARPSTPIL
jgi:ATP-binding protein involved in chromosome partitioning